MNVKLLKQLIMILFGTSIMAFAIVNFSIRYGLADGGFSGINLIVYRQLGINVWITNLILNFPFILILFKMSDLKTVLMTVYGVAALTGMLALWGRIGPVLPDWHNDLFLVIVCYGVIIGLGVGIVVKANGTTGGSVLVSKILNTKWDIPISKTLFLFDVCVISLSLLTVSLTSALYTLIGLFIASVVISKVQEGALFGYKVMIISDHYEQISDAVKHDLQRGATMIYAMGAHSGHDKRLLMVVIQKRELSKLKQLINDIDPASFVTVSHTYETLGEGFTYEQRMP
ncbi:MAG: YitT family protein [Defluviitaleaceae bacterium]|nr:YitT family protein [Defluviitaleaceae bacterium]